MAGATAMDTVAIPAGFHAADAPWGRVLVCAPLAAVARHAFTLRDLDLHADRNGSRRRWDAVAAWLGAQPPLRRARQVHGTAVVHAQGDAPASPPDGDIVVAVDHGLGVAVQVADCVPLLLADARSGAVAAAHAGWRGTAAGVAARAVAALRELAGTDPADVVAAIGPCIGPCCYEVGDEVREAFARERGGIADAWFAPGADGRWQLDLWAASRDQLRSAGIADGHVHLARLCTMTGSASFFSYRAEGAAAGRMCGAIRAGGPA